MQITKKKLFNSIFIQRQEILCIQMHFSMLFPVMLGNNVVVFFFIVHLFACVSLYRAELKSI